MSGSADNIELGKVVGVWGVKGWVKVYSYTRNRQDIGNYSNWILSSAQKGRADKNSKTKPSPAGVSKAISKTTSNSAASKEYVVEQCRLQGQNVVAKLVGIDNRDLAHALYDKVIFIKSSQLQSLPDNQFYWSQLLGLHVLNKQGEDLGVVDSMLETGANDVFVVKQSGEPEVERLIPYVDEVVLKIDVEAKTLLVDWDKKYLLDD